MEKKFAQGFIVKLPGEGAPEALKLKLSIKVDEAVPFISENLKNGYIKMDLLASKDGEKRYFTVNEYRPENAKDRIITDGFKVERPRDGVPEFVKAAVTVSEQFTDFLKRYNNDGWVNLNVFLGQNGFDVVLDNWKPTKEDFAKGKESFEDFSNDLSDTGAEALKKKLAEQEPIVDYPENPNPDDLPF